jgi:hypothetical protein
MICYEIFLSPSHKTLMPVFNQILLESPIIMDLQGYNKLILCRVKFILFHPQLLVTLWWPNKKDKVNHI